MIISNSKKHYHGKPSNWYQVKKKSKQFFSEYLEQLQYQQIDQGNLHCKKEFATIYNEKKSCQQYSKKIYHYHHHHLPSGIVMYYHGKPIKNNSPKNVKSIHCSIPKQLIRTWQKKFSSICDGKQLSKTKKNLTIVFIIIVAPVICGIVIFACWCISPG